MTLDTDPEFTYEGGSRKRKRGMPHDEWVYERVREGLVRDPEASAEDLRQRHPDLGMTLDQVRRVIAKVKERDERGEEGPRKYGSGAGRTRFEAEHRDFLLEWLSTTGSRKTLKNFGDALAIRFGLNMTESGISKALKRFRVCRKRLTKMDKRAFLPRNLEWTRRVSGATPLPDDRRFSSLEFFSPTSWHSRIHFLRRRDACHARHLLWT
jgi:hypothetical protein